MPSWRKPTAEVVARFLREQSSLDFSYPEVGATSGELPAGYSIDRTRVELGQGERPFLAGKQVLQTWRHFALGWVEAVPVDTPIVQGTVVIIAGRALGVWQLNACRIVYVIDEQQDDAVRFGFAYGTLPGHVERGEEQFLIEWNLRDNKVSYSILAFSRPRHVLAKLGYPLMRRLQKRFARESAAAVQKAVRERASDKK
jgi:uncharacterized protein (UPF0548 family)